MIFYITFILLVNICETRKLPTGTNRKVEIKHKRYFRQLINRKLNLKA